MIGIMHRRAKLGLEQQVHAFNFNRLLKLIYEWNNKMGNKEF